MKKNKNGGLMYSTNPDIEFNNDEESIETLEPQKQKLYVVIDKKQRNGKVVTLVQRFVGNEEDLKDLTKQIKSYCGVGGSCKDNEILIQGDCKDKIIKFLKSKNYGLVNKD
jgi:translation initiation factor 1